MQEYELPIVVTNQGSPATALLKVVRLPTSWYAVIWGSAERYVSFSQEKTRLNGGFAHLADDAFLDRVRLVADFTQGIEFDFDVGDEAVV